MNLQKLILCIIVIFFIRSNSKAQPKSEIIEKINDRIESIHLDTSLKSVTLQNTEFLENMTDGGGELTGFYKGNKIYRIYRSVGISYGVYITEFYYWKRKLMYVREKFNAYVYDDSLEVLDYTKINTTFSGSYYFYDQKLFDYRTEGHDRFENDTLDISKTLTDESDESLRFISNKLKSLSDQTK